MENKNIIIILVAVIIVLAAIVGVMFLHPTNAKEPTKIKITGNKTLTEGDGLSIKLTDSNNTAISDETVNVSVVDKKGKVVVNKTVKTNSKGKAKLDLDLKKGKYDVTVAYSGNDNFTGSNTTQKLTIKEEEKVVEEPVSESSYSSSSSSYDSGDPNGLADKAEAAGISYTRSDSGEVFVNEAEYAEYAARTGDTW